MSKTTSFLDEMWTCVCGCAQTHAATRCYMCKKPKPHMYEKGIECLVCGEMMHPKNKNHCGKRDCREQWELAWEDNAPLSITPTFPLPPPETENSGPSAPQTSNEQLEPAVLRTSDDNASRLSDDLPTQVLANRSARK